MTKNEARIEALATAFRAAQAAALSAEPGDDDGTCNMDCAVFRPERGLRSSIIEAAAREAGIHIRISDWFGRAVFLYVSKGQGNRRTRMAEAAQRALEDHGLNATVYYQMD
jgi:hypothetical protein